jgi:hypothetical protein
LYVYFFFFHGCKWGLLKIRKRNTEGTWWTQVESVSRETAFLFHVLLKPTLIQGDGRPRRFPPIMNKWGGAWAGPIQVQGSGSSPGNILRPKLSHLSFIFVFSALRRWIIALGLNKKHEFILLSC